MWHWSLYLALLPEVSDSPSLCNNWLRLRRLHRRPALAVRVEVICNKKQSGNIPPPLPRPRRQKLPTGLGAAWPRYSDTAWPHRIHHWSASHCRPRGSEQGPGSLTTNCRTRIDISVSLVPIDLCFCNAESVCFIKLETKWCHQTDVLIFPGVWPADTN